MRQRIKMASSLVHDPAVLLLDEPFNGMDPRQRIHLMELLRTMGAEGRTVLFSSHILEEVEQVARQIEVVVAGRHAASGDFGAIRRLMTDRPNRFVLRTADDRLMASVLLARPVGARRPAAVGGRHRGRGLRLRPVQRGAAAAGPRARRPPARGDPDRRVAGERLLLPGVVDDLARPSSGSACAASSGAGAGSCSSCCRWCCSGSPCWCGCSSARTPTPPRARSTASGSS